MANFIIVIDPDKDRRQRFVQAVMPMLPPISGLSLNSVDIGDCFIGWAATASAPITWVRDKGSAAVQWGEPVDDLSQRVGVNELMKLWCDPSSRAGSYFNGYYAAAAFSAENGLAVGADLLGIYPVYYWCSGEVVLVGSSPELFRHHPLFTVKMDPRGLVSVLLTMHIFGGRTIVEGVRRLEAGNMLIWNQGKGVRELRQYRVRVSTDRFDLPFSAHVDALDDAIDGAVRRCVPAGQHCSLLLSGGLDSRMLGGYLKEQRVDIDAVTMGVATDIEMKVAGKVANELGFPHGAVEVAYDEYAGCAERQARWESVSNGFNDIFSWGVNSRLASAGSPVVMGHVFDAVVGTRSIGWAYSPTSRTVSFDRFFEYANSWGIRRDVLDRLLRREVFAGMMEETVEEMMGTYRGFSDSGSQQAWCFNLYNRQRFHVGGSAWALSFGAWPVMPALDRNLLECAGSIPAASIAERRAQTELLCRRFPRLAALPLDRNSHDITPIQPRLRHQMRQAIAKRLRPVSSLFSRRANGDREDRYYYRVYDIDNPGWSTVRRQAEPYRKRLHDLFDKDVLGEYLPSPDKRTELNDRIVDASGLKVLVGLMMWAKDHS